MDLLSPEVLTTAFLIFVRVTTIVLLAPFFGSEIFFDRVKLFFAFLITIAVIPTVPLEGAVIPLDAKMLEIVIAIFKEIIVGLALGFVGQIIFGGVQFGGQFISIQVGLGFANVVDPRTQTQNPIFSQLFTLFGVLLFILMGGEQVFLRAMAKSFEIVPLGQVNAAAVAPNFIDMASDLFVIGVQLASPFIVVIFMLDLTFAIFARIMPQANIFFIALPLKVGGGLIVLWLIVPKLVVAFDGFFQRMYDYLAQVMQVMGS
jgi:flagellar biosynthetic protein FliR